MKLHLNKDSFNEFYTTYEQCDIVLGEIKRLGFLDGFKTICCPCDGAHSNIVKWLQKNTKAKVVFFDYLDCNSSKARSMMLRCECVITNPPFENSQWQPLFDFLKKSKLNYFLWGSPHNINDHLDYIFIVPSHRALGWNYNLERGVIKNASTQFFTNFDVPYLDYDYVPAEREQFYKGIPCYDHTKNIPKDYFGWMRVPITAIRYIKHYELKNCYDSVSSKYIRILIRRRKTNGQS